MALAVAQIFHKARTGITPPAVTTTIALTGITAGSLLVLAIAWFDEDADTFTSVSDNVNGAWTALTIRNGDANSHVQVFYRENSAAGSMTVTLTTSNGGSARVNTVEGDVLEITGALTSGAIDKDLGNSGTGTSASINFGTLAQADEILIMIGSHTGIDRVLTEDSADSFTLVSENEDADGGQTYLTQYKIVSSTVGPTANVTIAASENWWASGVSFEAAAGGEPSPVLGRRIYVLP